MNLEYLEDLLTKAKQMRVNELELAENLKSKTLEAFKHLFPEDETLHRSIVKLNFKSRLYPTSPAFEIAHFRETQGILTSSLDAKIDLLKHKEKLREAKGETELDSPRIRTLESIVRKLSKKNDGFSALIEQYKTESDLEKVNFSNLKRQLNNIVSENKTLTLQRDKAKRLNLAKLWSIVAIAYGIGVGTMVIKVDFDKRTLTEKLDAQKVIIDSLTKVVKSKTLVPIVPKRK
jgi:hypothetical protein